MAEERERAILGKTKEDEEREKEELERLKVQNKIMGKVNHVKAQYESKAKAVKPFLNQQCIL